jgi:hypothetical protein
MKRWQEERRIMQRQSRIWAESLHRVNEFGDEFLKPLGKFRKRRPCACGHTKCRLCHPDKVDGRKPYKVVVNDISVKEQIAELDS